MKKVFTLFFLISVFFLFGKVAYAQTSNCSTSTNNTSFKVEKCANYSQVPSGGADVTYTYKVTNTSSSSLIYRSISDNKITKITYVSGLEQYWNGSYGGYLYYLAPGSTAIWEATQRITQKTINAVTVTFSTGYSNNYGWQGTSTASTSLTVDVVPPSALSCNTLWYGGDNDCQGIAGTVGTLPNTGGAVTPKFNIASQTGDPSYPGTAAMAVNPLNPKQVYYIPRNLNTYSGLYVYDQITNLSTLLASATATPDVVRLAVSPDGKVWTIDATGRLWYWSSGTGWVDKGIITPNLSGLTSGDIAFDGNGTMYIIGATTVSPFTSYLYTITDAMLKSTGTISATLVGSMGTVQFTGIAFAENGTLYASAFISCYDQRLYTVNISTGSTTLVGAITGTSVADLGSCALPKPDLKATKTSDKVGTVTTGDTITYTIKVCNIGTLVATNVFLEDAVPGGRCIFPGSTP